MTREEAIKIFNEVLLFGKARCTQTEFEELAKMSIQALEQEPILDMVYADMQKLRGCSCICSDGIIDDIEDIIDNYKNFMDVQLENVR